jgi:gluconolactonase
VGVVVADTAELVDLIDPDAELTKVGEGYVFTEGPAWSPAEQAMYFSDIPGDARFRWSESGGVERIMAPTYKANGMAFDRDGCLIVCEHVTSAISRFHADGTHETVCFHHNGTYLNSPNDLVTYGRDGSIYFTDPDYGRWNDWIGCERPGRPLGFTAVFSVLPEGGEARLVSEPGEFEQPNGLCFSPD